MEEEKEKSLAEALMSAEVSDTTRHLLYCKGLVLDLQRSLIDEIDHIYDMETPEEKELADKVRNDLESIKSDVNHILHDEIDMNNEDIVPCI